MYVLGYLKEPVTEDERGSAVGVEYRLLCSGEVYNASVQTLDWRKSDLARILLYEPFALLVCSYPFHDYPQELTLRFTCRPATEQHGLSTWTFHPDEEIAKDISALLTLFCRRLITVAGKVKESHPSQANSVPFCGDWPIGFITSFKGVFWKRWPPQVVNYPNRQPIILDYNPLPRAVDQGELARFLAVLSQLPQAESVVRAARLYALALEHIQGDHDLAYHYLITCAETVANEAMQTFSPSDNDKIDVKRKVAELATSFGLGESEANKLAIEACRGMSWSKRKFVTFLKERASCHIWEDDDLFRELPQDYLPSKKAFEDALDEIYDHRGKYMHSGASYPPVAGLGRGPTVPLNVAIGMSDTVRFFPPVVWFERVVNSALRQFVLECGNLNQPDDTHQSVPEKASQQ